MLAGGDLRAVLGRVRARAHHAAMARLPGPLLRPDRNARGHADPIRAEAPRAAPQRLTRIEIWHPPHRFIDVQLDGPYRLWVHTYTFVPRDAGTTIFDRVRYQLPLRFLGELARLAIVRRDLERI